jgi:hypothetical protein
MFNIVYIIIFTLAIIVCIKGYIERPEFMMLLIIAWLITSTIKAIVELVERK